MPKEAEEWDLERIISDYADAAERMKAGGMDGLELECYGHFIDQFWSPITNVREDEYGGSLENRMKIPLSIFRAVRERTGDDFIVGTRIAIDETKPGGIRAEAGMQIVKMLEDEGLIDFVNVIRGYVASDVDLTEVIPIHGMPAAPHLDFAGRVREATDLPVLHASKIDDVATARHAIAEGKLDMVGMTLDDIDIVELNEAFASQVLYCQRILEIPDEKLNPMGGSISIGHPYGMSGARMVGQILRHLKRTGGRFGLVTMCVGGGQGAAGLFEVA